MTKKPPPSIDLIRVSIVERDGELLIVHKRTGATCEVSKSMLDNWAVSKLRSELLQPFGDIIKAK